MENWYKTNAIILKKQNWRENDLFFYLYTEKFGKITAVASGTRKIQSKLSGHLNNFGIVELNFVKGKQIKRITHAYLLEQKKLISADDIFFISAILEIIEATTKENDQSNAIWLLINQAIDKIIELPTKADKLLMLNFYILKLVNLLGYKLKSDKCSLCHAKLTENIYFNFKINDFVCSSCNSFDYKISLDAFELIRDFYDNTDKKISLINKTNLELFNFLNKYLTYIFEKKFKSLEILSQRL